MRLAIDGSPWRTPRLGAKRRSLDTHGMTMTSKPPRSTRRWAPVGDVVPLWRRVVSEGLVHRDSLQGGVVASEGQDGHRVTLV